MGINNIKFLRGGKAFVKFKTAEDLEKAITKKGQILGGNEIYIEKARS